MQVGTHRPTAVTGLAVLAFILCALSAVTGLAAVWLGFVAALTPDYVAFSLTHAATFLFTFGGVVFSVGILEIAYGVGFFEGKGWSWTLGIVVAAASLVSTIVVVAMAVIAGPSQVIVLAIVSFFPLIAVIPLTASIVTIYCLTRSRVKAFFGKGAANI